MNIHNRLTKMTRAKEIVSNITCALTFHLPYVICIIGIFEPRVCLTSSVLLFELWVSRNLRILLLLLYYYYYCYCYFFVIAPISARTVDSGCSNYERMLLEAETVAETRKRKDKRRMKDTNRERESEFDVANIAIINYMLQWIVVIFIYTARTNIAVCTDMARTGVFNQ